jgi:hypothetical protein
MYAVASNMKEECRTECNGQPAEHHTTTQGYDCVHALLTLTVQGKARQHTANAKAVPANNAAAKHQPAVS